MATLLVGGLEGGVMEILLSSKGVEDLTSRVIVDIGYGRARTIGLKELVKIMVDDEKWEKLKQLCN